MTFPELPNLHYSGPRFSAQQSFSDGTDTASVVWCVTGVGGDDTANAGYDSLAAVMVQPWSAVRAMLWRWFIQGKKNKNGRGGEATGKPRDGRVFLR